MHTQVKPKSLPTNSLKIANLQSSQILLYCIENLEIVIKLWPENLGNGLYVKVSTNINFRHQMVNSYFALTFLSKKPCFLRHYARSVSSAFGIPKKKEGITPCTKTSAAYLEGKFQGGIKMEVSAQKKATLKLFLISYELMGQEIHESIKFGIENS